MPQAAAPRDLFRPDEIGERDKLCGIVPVEDSVTMVEDSVTMVEDSVTMVEAVSGSGAVDGRFHPWSIIITAVFD